MTKLKGFKLTNKGLIALILIGALLVGAIWLNASLKRGGGQSASNENKKDDSDSSADLGGEKTVSAGVYQNYFAGFREERNSLRAKEIDYLRLIINEGGTDPDTLQNAQQRLMELVESMEKEFSIESMIRSKGFLDAAVTMRNGSVSVVISGDTLSDEEVARILDIIKTETGAPASKIKISVSGT